MDKEAIVKELEFKAIRSSGAGGQNVNKVSSKIELLFSIDASAALTELEKKRIHLKLENKISKEGALLLQCDTSRSQHKNKELIIERFLELVENALKTPKKRKKTNPSKSSIEKRLHQKKKRAIHKLNRKKPRLD